jgi:hypothetical protein
MQLPSVPEALQQGESQMIIKFTEQEMTHRDDFKIELPDDYFPDSPSISVMGTFRCPICQSKHFYVLPNEVGAMFTLILGGVPEEGMGEAMMKLVAYVQTLDYLNEAERLHLLTGVCSVECEFEWVNSKLWEDE